MVIRYCISRQELFQSPDFQHHELDENDEASPGILEVAENSLRFFQFKRSREKFNRVVKETFPLKSSKKLRTAYAAGRKALYCKCRGTALIRALRMAIFLTCFAGLWSWVVILLQNISSKEDSNLNHHVTQFLAHSKALGKLTEAIHTYGTCELVYKIMRSKMRQIGVWKRFGLTLPILALRRRESTLPRICTRSCICITQFRCCSPISQFDPSLCGPRLFCTYRHSKISTSDIPYIHKTGIHTERYVSREPSTNKAKFFPPVTTSHLPRQVYNTCLHFDDKLVQVCAHGGGLCARGDGAWCSSPELIRIVANCFPRQ